MGPELYRVIKSENERFGFATNKTVILSSLPPDNARSCSGAFQTACDHRPWLHPPRETGRTLHEKKIMDEYTPHQNYSGTFPILHQKTDTLVIFGLTIDLQLRLPCICENHQRLAPVSHPAVPGPHIGCNGNGNDRWHGQAVGTGGPRPAGGYLGQGPRDQKSGVHTEK